MPSSAAQQQQGALLEGQQLRELLTQHALAQVSGQARSLAQQLLAKVRLPLSALRRLGGAVLTVVRTG